MDHLFPSYHLRPPRGFINDPNGPVIIDETVHLYFQSRPTTDTSVPVQWGHATSKDFVRWQLHRPAMSPHPTGPDRDGCFSGNTVLTGEGLRAFYSGHIERKHFQSVLTALSTDGGYTFGQPSEAIPDPSLDENVVMFRDPFVWQTDTGWRMAVGAELVGQLAAVRLYESADLKAWTYRGHLAERVRSTNPGFDTGAGWECPQVVTIDGEDIVVVAAWSQSGLSGEVLAVRDGHLTRVDSGTSFYAASAMRDSPHGPLLFGWVTEGADSSMWSSQGWAGAISLPRVVSLGDRHDLLSDPVPALDLLRATEVVGEQLITASSAFELRLPHVSGRTRVRFGRDEWMGIEVDVATNTLLIDQDRASTDPRAHRGVITVSDAFSPGRRADAVRIFIDGSIVEAFTSAGRGLTCRVYPTTPPPWSIESPHNAVLHDLTGAFVASPPATAALIDVRGPRVT
jgi:beta-fructofuranosidase